MENELKQGRGREGEREREKGIYMHHGEKLMGPNMCKAGKAPGERANCKGSGLALCSLEERWTGGEQSRPMKGRWIFIS